ncbi:AbrB family transcriptional regulator [Thetidibacter halocola]|uniref:AbrB family transcriptional regulator n=1 Tax=Thetidibacter halocola TaxID=2827239 RepID=A0A8J8B5Y3_9RHOB|nr:AbrB family transcriptional regulator [Thetidibacter halocola]MBS0122777.1 AbrB family transcriptional regulator [Thetidibacter halocola]
MILPQPLPRFAALTTLMIATGAIGGFAASQAGLPMPWMLGSLLASALVVLLWAPPMLRDYSFPNPWRSFFIALIGVMIGSQVTPDVLRQAASLPLTLLALLVFIGVAHWGNYLIFRRLGGYDRATAFYSGTPGGLMESIMLGEGAGADVRILTAQQFLRIILVITTIPLALSLWTGTAVGSAAGLTGPAAEPVSPQNLALIALTAGLGLWGGQRLGLPAAQLSGPLILAAAATMTGALDLHLPFWLIATAQLVIGMTLGLRFKGTDGALLRRCLWLSAVSVAYMLILGAVLAVILHALTDLGYLTLLLSFAPGGVSEMSLVALSLAVSPALVSLHHILRIVLTVLLLGWAAKRFGFN